MSGKFQRLRYENLRNSKIFKNPDLESLGSCIKLKFAKLPNVRVVSSGMVFMRRKDRRVMGLLSRSRFDCKI